MRPTTTTLAAVGLAALVGCSLIAPQGPKGSPARGRGKAEAGEGTVIAPKRCALRVAILARPLKDEAMNEALWRGADEQALPAEVRHALEANGLRIGVATGELPAAVRAVLDAPPPRKVDPKMFVLPDGESSLVDLKAATPQVTLLLNRRGATAGRDYQDARGALRLTAAHDGEANVSLRVVPEVHHGPLQHRFGGAPNGGAFAPQQFVVKDGQEEETFRDLAAALTLKPTQVAVIGSIPGRPHSVGDFLLTEPEAGSDRLLQKVVLVWASASAEPATPATAAPPPDLEPIDPEPPKLGEAGGRQ